MAKSLRKEHDFEQFLKVLRRDGKPDYLPFYEHIASPEFMATRMEITSDQVNWSDDRFLRRYVDFWVDLGFDCIPLEIPLNCPINVHEAAKESRGSESGITISTMADFDAYPWPDLSRPIEFSFFEKIGKLMPDGVKIVGGVSGGPFEWVSWMMGVQGLSMAIYTDPELVGRMFDMIGGLILSADRQLATMDTVGALRQGDDLGFKTSTFLNPEHLRQYVFPIYTRMVAEAHGAGKPFVLHSCGNLKEVYDDLIDDCKIDAKHSFEDQILPVDQFKAQYGRRVTPLGGLDVDKICRLSHDEIRAYTRKMVEKCFADGHWALGTGNSLTDYMPVDNYVVMLEEGIKVAG